MKLPGKHGTGFEGRRHRYGPPWPFGLRIVVVISALALGATACGDGVEAAHRLTVQVVAARPGTICDDPGGKDYQGMSFAVVNEAGDTLAEGTLGHWEPGTGTPDPFRGRNCSFRAEVEVADSPNYSIRFNGKKPLSFAREDLIATGWVASIDAVPWKVTG